MIFYAHFEVLSPNTRTLVTEGSLDTSLLCVISRGIHGSEEDKPKENSIDYSSAFNTVILHRIWQRKLLCLGQEGH